MKYMAGRDSSMTTPQAGGALSALVRDDKHVGMDLDEALQCRIHLHEVTGDARQAAGLEDEARHRLAALTTKLDPAAKRILTFWVGAVLVTILVALDIVPLNWAAQAFDLAVAGTWLITGIMLVASLAAMVGLEVTRSDARKRAALVVVVAAAFVGLLVLRTQFLITVVGESLWSALLQAVFLTAVSASLVLCGSAVMARTQQFRIARARAEVRRSAQDAQDGETARIAAAKRMHRHVEALRMRVHTASVPAGTDRVTWAASLEGEIQALFPEL
jgi:hypothetical protein